MEFAEHGDISRQVRFCFAMSNMSLVASPHIMLIRPHSLCRNIILMHLLTTPDLAVQIEKFKKANKYIKEETVWSYTIQIAQSLDAMHSRNVLHRDIKPKNVFLTGKNHVRLGDLGCAKLMKSGMARTQIGTPYYMSPEIWANKPYDVKSDVWALGCLVYELAQLSPPFLANDMNGLAAKVKNTAAPRISKHYSEDLANLVAQMLGE